jgi:AraC-like DNA-binding protein
VTQASRFSLQRGWKLMLSDIGLNPTDVLTLAGLPADLFAQQDASLSPAEYYRLRRGLEQAVGSDELPLKIGQHISVEAFDPPIFASLCSPNLNTALQRLREFKKLIGPLTLMLDINTRQTLVTLDCYGNDEPIPRSLGVAELVFITQLARLATRQRIVPLEVRLVQLPDDLEPYREYFGVAPRIGKAIRISFSAQDALRPFLTEDAGMWDFFEAGLKKRLAHLDTGASATQRVRSMLLEMLPSGQSTIEETASRLATSKRSLQRRLSDELSSYQEVLDTTRRELAQHYLARSSISPKEIAYLLGFHEGNSFIRSFKRWTGKTPGEYRQRA